MRIKAGRNILAAVAELSFATISVRPASDSVGKEKLGPNRRFKRFWPLGANSPTGQVRSLPLLRWQWEAAIPGVLSGPY